MSARPRPHAAPAPVGGVTLMIAATGFFSLMFACVKALGAGFPFFEAVFFRALFGLPLVLALVLRRGGRLWPRRPLLMLARGLFGFAAMSGYFYAVQRGQLAELAVIARTQPIFIACLAPLLLHERITGVALGALAAGFGGALLVIKPGFGGLFDSAGLAAMSSAVLSALAHIAVRRLGATERPELIVLYFTLVVGSGSAALGGATFVAPTGAQLVLMGVVALCATAGQLLMTAAYARDRAPIVSASAYSSVVFATVLGYAFWGELPDLLAWIGASIVVAAGIALAFSRRGVREPPSPT